MSSRPDELRSIEGICDVDVVAARTRREDRPPTILFELPHGATRRIHFEQVRDRLSSALPSDLQEFFFVNTDVGSAECAARVARLLVDGQNAGGRESDEGPARVLLVRSLLPRTFIDCNRLLEDSSRSEMTAAVPEYVDQPGDRLLLRSLYDEYQAVARAAYSWVCGNGGLAVQLHTYAPRSIRIDRIDGDIVDRLRQAYLPGTWERWPERPPVDLISAASDGAALAPKAVVAEIRRRFAAEGIDSGENETYRLHPETTAYRHARSWPGQVVCLELRRDLLADPFSPFVEMEIGEAKVERMARPLADACSAAWPVGSS